MAVSRALRKGHVPGTTFPTLFEQLVGSLTSWGLQFIVLIRED